MTLKSIAISLAFWLTVSFSANLLFDHSGVYWFALATAFLYSAREEFLP